MDGNKKKVEEEINERKIRTHLASLPRGGYEELFVGHRNRLCTSPIWEIGHMCEDHVKAKVL